MVWSSSLSNLLTKSDVNNSEQEQKGVKDQHLYFSRIVGEPQFCDYHGQYFFCFRGLSLLAM